MFRCLREASAHSRVQMEFGCHRPAYFWTSVACMSIIHAFGNYVGSIMLIFPPLHLCTAALSAQGRYWTGWLNYALSRMACWNGIYETRLKDKQKSWLCSWWWEFQLNLKKSFCYVASVQIILYPEVCMCCYITCFISWKQQRLIAIILFFFSLLFVFGFHCQVSFALFWRTSCFILIMSLCLRVHLFSHCLIKVLVFEFLNYFAQANNVELNNLFVGPNPVWTRQFDVFG